MKQLEQLHTLSHWELITKREFVGVTFDTNLHLIELFPNGGIKFYMKENGLDFETFDLILHHIYDKNIVNFKIFGSYHSERFQKFLKQYKTPLLPRYNTEKILENISELKANAQNHTVLRCSGQLYGKELLNLLLLQGEKEFTSSKIKRNHIIQELGKNIGAQTNWNTAYSKSIELGYDIEYFKPMASIIFGFLHILNWNYYTDVFRVVLKGDRITIHIGRLSNLTKEFFYLDWERQIHAYKFSKKGLLINNCLWKLREENVPALFFKLVYTYFSENNVTSVRLSQLSLYIKEKDSFSITERQLTKDNVRKNYIPKINEVFEKDYKGKILDITGDLIEAKNLKGIERIYPVRN